MLFYNHFLAVYYVQSFLRHAEPTIKTVYFMQKKRLHFLFDFKHPVWKDSLILFNINSSHSRYLNIHDYLGSNSIPASLLYMILRSSPWQLHGAHFHLKVPSANSVSCFPSISNTADKPPFLIINSRPFIFFFVYTTTVLPAIHFQSLRHAACADFCDSRFCFFVIPAGANMLPLTFLLKMYSYHVHAAI